MTRRLIYLSLMLLMIVSSLAAQKEFTLQDIYENQKFADKYYGNMEWVPQKSLISYVAYDSVKTLFVYDIKENHHRKLFDVDSMPEFKTLSRVRRVIPRNHYWAPDGNSILLINGKDLYLYSIESSVLDRLTYDSIPKSYPTFSPDGKYISFIMENNLYVVEISSKEVKQLTTQGKPHILVGYFDWVYEEEFGLKIGYSWSDDSKKIAFYKVDESREPEFPIVDFSEVHNSVEKIRYPKPGDPNAIIEIGVVNIETGKTVWMDIGDEKDIYIPRMQWVAGSDKVAIQRMNRRQNHLELLIADIYTGESRVILEEKEEHGWIRIRDDLTFIRNGKEFIWTSDRSNYYHIYLYNIDGTLKRQLTDGEWDVKGVLSVDQERKVVYFKGCIENPFETHLYRTGLNGKGLRRITVSAGTHTVSIDSKNQVYIDRYCDNAIPTRIGLYSIKGKEIAIIDEGASKSLEGYELALPELVRVPTEDGDYVNATIIKPIDFDSTKKYPVIFRIYGGPGSQSIDRSWGGSSFLWSQYMVQNGYIFFRLDNRGTGGRGKKFSTQVYGRLGEYEVKDMVNGATYLSTLPYIDKDRLGMWGWSYGGYVTIMNLLRAGEYFKAGVAIAPVTDWRNYDSIYTERYMDTPANNPDGYEAGNTLNYAEQLQGKLLLVHGTADDNVHMANTMQLAEKFQMHNKQFDLMLYTGKQHSIYGVRYHLFKMVSDFFFENL